MHLVGEEHAPPYERPALSKELLTGTKTPESLALRPDGFWREQEIELVTGISVTRVDARSRIAVTDRRGGSCPGRASCSRPAPARGRFPTCHAACTSCARSRTRFARASCGPAVASPSSAPGSSAAKWRRRATR